jgi:hypothetical protein
VIITGQFWLDVKKGKTLLGFVNKLFISVQLIFFLDHVLLLAELAQKFKFFKIAVLQSDSNKRNFGRFIFNNHQFWSN